MAVMRAEAGDSRRVADPAGGPQHASALFAVAWTVLSYWEAKGPSPGAPSPAFEMLMGIVAFLAWSTGVPARPFGELDLPTFVGPLTVAVLSAVLAYAARPRAIWAKRTRQS